jgi:hypothetical protein
MRHAITTVEDDHRRVSREKGEEKTPEKNEQRRGSRGQRARLTRQSGEGALNPKRQQTGEETTAQP